MITAELHRLGKNIGLNSKFFQNVNINVKQTDTLPF